MPNLKNVVFHRCTIIWVYSNAGELYISYGSTMLGVLKWFTNILIIDSNTSQCLSRPKTGLTKVQVCEVTVFITFDNQKYAWLTETHFLIILKLKSKYEKNKHSWAKTLRPHLHCKNALTRMMWMADDM